MTRQEGPIGFTSRILNFCIKVMWFEISTAPFNRDLELAVIDSTGTHATVYPCRRVVGGWMKADTEKRVDLQPTHWREWTNNK